MRNRPVHRRVGRLVVAVPILAGALLAATGPARANGRYPAAGLIALDPSDPDHLVIRTTYGLLSSSDGAKTWRWTCEQAIGFGDNEDPMVAITKNGTVLAGLFNGLSVSSDRACSWTFVGGELTDRFVVDLSVEKQSPERAVAVVSNGIGGGSFNTQVFETADDGATWTQAGVSLPEELLGLTIDAAPSDPNRLYVTGREGAPDYPGVIYRSGDRGQTWDRLAVTGSDDKSLPFLAAIDPNDPDTLYVRLDRADADTLVVSKDGGATWTEAFTGIGGLLGFALSPDGSKVAVGGDKDKLWIAPSDTLAFAKVSEVGVRCLLWSGDAIYACADEFKDGFEAGVSRDVGKTFEAIGHLAAICPIECSGDSPTEALCADRWGVLSETINAAPCEGLAGGAGGASATGGTGGSAPAPETGSGCSCDYAGTAAPSGFAAALATVLAWVALRRAGGRSTSA